MVTSRILFTAKQKDELWRALEERTKCVSHLPGAGKEEQDRRPADTWLSMEGSLRRRVAELSAALKLEEREEISRGIAAGRSVRRMAHEVPGRTIAIDDQPGEIDATAVRRLTVRTGPEDAWETGAAP